MRGTILSVSIAAAAFAGPSAASTPGEWANLDRRVTGACIAMSGLARPAVLKRKISTSDVIGVEVRMVRGTDDRGRFQRKICVFDRRTSRTEVHDAGGWFGDTVRP